MSLNLTHAAPIRKLDTTRPVSSLAGKKQVKSALASALVSHDMTRLAKWMATR